MSVVSYEGHASREEVGYEVSIHYFLQQCNIYQCHSLMHPLFFIDKGIMYSVYPGIGFMHAALSLSCSAVARKAIKNVLSMTENRKKSAVLRAL